MMTVLRRSAPLIGLVVFVFSATIVLAGSPIPSHGGPGSGLLADETSSETVSETESSETESSETESSETESSETESSETESSETESSESESESSTDSADHCNVDLTQDLAVLAGLNHGSVVCSAAHQDPPDGYSADGFKNHGAWVSYWAKLNHGSGNGHGHGQSQSSGN